MTLSFHISEQQTKLLKALHLTAAKTLESLNSLDQGRLDALHRQARISTIGATTRIENAVLTNAQIEWIDTELEADGRPTAFTELRPQIQAKLTQDRERSLEEVAGCREMLAIVYSQGSELIPLTHATLCGLHRELLQYHGPAAFHLGRYKQVPNSVLERLAATGEERIVLQTSAPGPITETAIADLLDWYNAHSRAHPWPVAVASELVFRFLACHPFQDGNGRLGRALFLLALLQSDDPHLPHLVPYLAIDRYIEQHRVEYYAVLARVSGGRFHPDPTTYQLELFGAFMLKAMDAALDSVAHYRRRVNDILELSEAATNVLQCFKDQPEQRLSPKQLRQHTDLPPRTVTRILASLVEANLIQRYGRGPGTRYQLVF